MNDAVHLCKDLHKYDHACEPALNCLPIELLVQYRCSLCAMHNQLKFQCSQLEPPIVASWLFPFTCKKIICQLLGWFAVIFATLDFFALKPRSGGTALLRKQDFSSTLFSYLLNNWVSMIYKLIIVCFCVCKFFVFCILAYCSCIHWCMLLWCM